MIRAYPRSQYVQAMSFVTMPGLVGPLIGPSLGGWIVEIASWHWIFLINIPVGIVGSLLTHNLMPDFRGYDQHRFDWVGFILFANCMVMISLALEGFGELKLAQLLCFALLASGFACLLAYVLHAKRHESPLFSLDLFNYRWFTLGISGGLLARLGAGAMPFLTPLFLQVGLGFSASFAGLTMIPLAAAALTIKPLAKTLIDKLGFKQLLAFNTILVGALIASFGLIDTRTPYIMIIFTLALFGAANSLQFTLMNTITLQELPDEHASAGNSALSVVMQLSRSLGVAIAGLLLGQVAGANTTLLATFHYTYLILGGVTAMCALLFLQLTPYRAPDSIYPPPLANQGNNS